MSSSSTQSGPVGKVTVDWAPVKKFFTNELIWAFVILPILIVVITILGRSMKVHSLGAEASNPSYLHVGDVLYLNNHKTLTVTLMSRLPFDIKTGVEGNNHIVAATQDFDDNYWLRRLKISEGGFRVNSAKAPVKLGDVLIDQLPSSYTLYSETAGFAAVHDMPWAPLSWILRICMAFFIFFIPFCKYVIIPEEKRAQARRYRSW